MKRYLTMLTVLLAFLGASDSAQAQECSCNCLSEQGYFYSRDYLGTNFLVREKSHYKENYRMGFLLSSAFGYRLNNGLRFESEFAYRYNCARNIHFEGKRYHFHRQARTFSLMANALWDLPIAGCGYDLGGLQPFVGAGVGYDFIFLSGRYKHIGFGKDSFAWQVIAGVNYPIRHNTDLSLEYKFHKSQAMRFGEDHSVGLGIIYKFDLL